VRAGAFGTNSRTLEDNLKVSTLYVERDGMGILKTYHSFFVLCVHIKYRMPYYHIPRYLLSNTLLQRCLGQVRP
jgi:hypothetical protein